MVLFALVVAGGVFAERNNMVDYVFQVGPVTLVLKVLVVVIARHVARFPALGLRQRIAISI